MNDKEEKGQKIEAIFIMEIIGKPREHLVESLTEIIKQMKEEKNIEINDTIQEPTELKDNPEFFTTFAEVEIKAKNIFDILIMVFKYMPAHVEIISPEKLTLTHNNLNELLNELTRRLHGYDEVTRVIQIEKSILENKLRELIKVKEE